MREKPAVIKAINALKGTSSDEPIDHVSGISENMALQLVDMGYATKTPWSKDPNKFCYRVNERGYLALKAKPEPKRKLQQLSPRITEAPSRIK